jgi:amino acid transporter
MLIFSIILIQCIGRVGDEVLSYWHMGISVYKNLELPIVAGFIDECIGVNSGNFLTTLNIFSFAMIFIFLHEKMKVDNKRNTFPNKLLIVWLITLIFTLAIALTTIMPLYHYQCVVISDSISQYSFAMIVILGILSIIVVIMLGRLYRKEKGMCRRLE